jgi:hypothetical protein
MRRPTLVVIAAALAVAMLPVLNRWKPTPAGGLVPPASCQDVHNLDPAAGDGDNLIVANGAYCRCTAMT